MNTAEKRQKQSMKSLSDKCIREWYITQTSKIPELLDRTASQEEQAREAYRLRMLYRAEARAKMPDREAAAELDLFYPQKSFEELIEEKMRRKGLSLLEAYRDTIRSSAQTNKKVNDILGVGGKDDA